MIKNEVRILRLINGIEVLTEVQGGSNNCKNPLQIVSVVEDKINFSQLAPYSKTAFVKINFDLVLLHHIASDELKKMWHEASDRLLLQSKGITPANAGDLNRIKVPPPGMIK